MQVSYVTLLTYKSSVTSDSTNPFSSHVNEIKQLILNLLLLLKHERNFRSTASDFQPLLCAVQLKCLFLSLFPITNLMSFPTVTESLNLHEYSFYSFGSLNMFWIIELEEASVPVRCIWCRTKNWSVFCKIQNAQPLFPKFNCWRRKEDSVWRFIGTNYFTQTFFSLAGTSGW